MRLRTKLALFASLLIVAAVVSVSVGLFLHERRRIPEELRAQALTLSRGFAQVCRESMLSKDDILPINYLNLFLKGPEEIAQAMFVKSDGTIQVHTDPKLVLERWDEGREGMPLAAASQEQLREITVSRAGQATPVVAAVIPVVLPAGGQAGFVRIDFSKARWERLIASQLAATRARIASVTIGILLVGVIGALIFALVMARPIQQLAAGAKAIGSGRLDYRITSTSRDELGDLAREFNEMGRKLQELDEMKSNFVSSVSHELRSPLTAIKGYVEQILKGRAGPLTEQQQEFLTIVKNNTARLGGFINDILDLAKIEAKQLDLRLETLPVAPLANEIVALFRFQAEEKSITLSSTIPDQLPPARMDQDKIRQVLTNLVSNALKFTPEKGRVTMSAETQDGSLLVRVSDTGLGIPKEDQPAIFDKFRQSRSVQARAKKVKGTGLGLAIVKGIIEGHGGTIVLESEVDKGTTVSFTVPLAPGRTTA